MTNNVDHNHGDGGAGSAPPSSALIGRIRKSVILAEQSVAAILLLTIIVLVFGQVVARYVFNAPLYWSDELARYTYVWLTFIGATFVFARGDHISVDIFGGWVGRRTNELVDLFGKIVIIMTCIFFIWGSWTWVLSNILPRSSALQMPMVYLFGVVWLCFALTALHGMTELYLHLVHKIRHKREGEIQCK